MAIAKTVDNNLLLNAWQRVVDENEYSFNQVAGKGAPLNKNCDVYIQSDRETIARALDQSLKKIARVLRYWPRPKWFQGTLHLGAGVPTRFEYLQTNTTEEGGSWKLIEFGQRATTLIDDNATVTYSDSGYGVNDTATISVATSVTNPDEIQIFFRTADGAPGAADPRYQIEPARVSISGGVATIVASRWLFVKPNTIWDVPWVVGDPNNRERNKADSANTSSNFVTDVDVYRVYNDTTTQLELLDTNNDVLDTFTAEIVDDELGGFTFTRDCWDSWRCYCHHPTRLRVSYRAGQPLVNGYMDAELEDAIVRLANVLMPVELCTFQAPTKNRWENDRNPMVQQNISVLTPADLKNGFGSTLAGAVYAWRTAVDRSIASGGKITMRMR